LKRNPYFIEPANAMKSDANKTGLSLVEMLIVVAIVVILTTMVIGLAGRINDQSNERLTKSTIGIFTTALGQFHDYGYRYKDNPVYTPAERQFYLGLDFPLDCNGFDVPTLQMTLDNVLGLAPGSVLINPVVAHNDPNYSGGEVLYFFLSQVPECRKTLDKVDESLITSEGYNKQPMTVAVGGRIYPLFRIIDPWGETLRYDYYDELEVFTLDRRYKSRRTFPVITSAGPDRRFGTADDISSRK
jgi:prepilin-type N-terminal cleavage/methylation domain-containing protein